MYVCVQFTLLFQNRTEDDILLKDELEQLQQTYRDRLVIHYYLSNPGTEEFGEFVYRNKKVVVLQQWLRRRS
jgi:NAD(P)H-flavin reductase